VSVNGAPVPVASNGSSLVAAPYGAEGWFLQPDGVLLLRFQSSGQDVVRVVLTPPPQGNLILAALALAAPYIVLAAAVGVDVTIWVRFVRGSRPQTRPDSADRR